MLKLILLSVALTAQAPAPLQWFDVTNHPGWQALGRRNANGYVVDIAQWKRKGDPVPTIAQNFGISLPSPTAGEHVRSNDKEFAESIETEIAEASKSIIETIGQAAKEASEAGPRPCPGPGPCPKPKPPYDDDLPSRYDLPKVNVVPFLLAGLCVIAGMIVLLGVAFLTYFLTTPRTPNAPR